jgi:hypothetical protein
MQLTFSEVIKKGTIKPSYFPKTGEDYCFGGLVVFQFVKSTKNVWVDKMFSDKIGDRKQFEIDLRSHFGNVKNVYFDFELNSTNETFHKKIAEILGSFKK